MCYLTLLDLLTGVVEASSLVSFDLFLFLFGILLFIMNLSEIQPFELGRTREELIIKNT